MNTWENPPYSDEDAYESLCDNSEPSDFYFYVKEDPDPTFGCTIIYLAPKLYFDKEKYMWDQSMFLDHILPDDFGEDMESVWSCERPGPEVRKDLLSRGFVENEEFSKLVDKSFD